MHLHKKSGFKVRQPVGLHAQLQCDFTRWQQPVGDSGAVITYSGGANGTRVNGAGLVEAATTPRIDFQQQNSQVHNICLHSENFSSGLWVKTHFGVVTVTDDFIEGPTGKKTAAKLVFNAGDSRIYQDMFTRVLDNTVYNFSIWLRTPEPNSTNTWRVFVKPGAGSFITPPTPIVVTNEWQRFSFSGDVLDSTVETFFSIQDLEQGAGTLYAWGAQVSVGSAEGEYVKTHDTTQYSPRVMEPQGLLIETAATNLAVRSESIGDVTYWAQVRCSGSADYIVSPDGTKNAGRFIEDSTASATHYLADSNDPTLVDATEYTVSVFAKAGRRGNFAIWCSMDTNEGFSFDVLHGVVGAQYGGTATAKIKNYGNGWFRCSITFTSDGTVVATQFRVMDEDFSDGYNGDGVSDMYFWGFQFETGEIASSYISADSGSAVTRTADSAQISDISGFINASEGTIAAQVRFGLTQPVTNQSAVNIGDGTVNNFILLRTVGATAAAVCQVWEGGGQVANMVHAVQPEEDPYRFVVGYKLNDYACAIDGSAVIIDTSAAVPTFSVMNIGDNYNGQKLNGHVQKISYYNERLPNNRLIDLSKYGW